MSYSSPLLYLPACVTAQYIIWYDILSHGTTSYSLTWGLARDAPGAAAAVASLTFLRAAASASRWSNEEIKRNEGEKRVGWMKWQQRLRGDLSVLKHPQQLSIPFNSALLNFPLRYSVSLYQA